jgi:hypothetical protein
MDTRKPIEPETVRRVKLIEVIETVSLKGNGIDTIAREVTQYWSKEGVLLAENDRLKGENKVKGEF